MIYVKSGFNTIPERVRIDNYNCRIWYASRQHKCERCQQNHRTSDVDQCRAYREDQPDIEVFVKGPFSNFANCKMMMDELSFPTSEHCYQWYACMEHLNTDLAEQVMHAKSPQDAKNIAAQIKGDTNICDWGRMRYDVMKRVLMAKAESNQQFRDQLWRSPSDGEFL